eukprot:PhF_6_TR32195/c0_g1_i1/m.47840
MSYLISPSPTTASKSEVSASPSASLWTTARSPTPIFQQNRVVKRNVEFCPESSNISPRRTPLNHQPKQQEESAAVHSVPPSLSPTVNQQSRVHRKSLTPHHTVSAMYESRGPGGSIASPSQQHVAVPAEAAPPPPQPSVLEVGVNTFVTPPPPKSTQSTSSDDINDGWKQRLTTALRSMQQYAAVPRPQQQFMMSTNTQYHNEYHPANTTRRNAYPPGGNRNVAVQVDVPTTDVHKLMADVEKFRQTLLLEETRHEEAVELLKEAHARQCNSLVQHYQRSVLQLEGTNQELTEENQRLIQTLENATNSIERESSQLRDEVRALEEARLAQQIHYEAQIEVLQKEIDRSRSVPLQTTAMLTSTFASPTSPAHSTSPIVLTETSNPPPPTNSVDVTLLHNEIQLLKDKLRAEQQKFAKEQQGWVGLAKERQRQWSEVAEDMKREREAWARERQELHDNIESYKQSQESGVTGSVAKPSTLRETSQNRENAELESLRQEVKHLQIHNSALLEQLESYSHTTVEERIGLLNGRIQTLQTNLEDQQRLTDTQAHTVAVTLDQCKALETQLSSVTARCAVVQEERDRLLKERTEELVTADELRMWKGKAEELPTLKARIEALEPLQETVRGLTEELTMERQRYASLRTKLEAMGNVAMKYDDTMAKNHAMQLSAKQTEMELESLRKTNELMQSELEHAHSNIQQLRLQVASLDSRNKALMDEIAVSCVSKENDKVLVLCALHQQNGFSGLADPLTQRAGPLPHETCTDVVSALECQELILTLVNTISTQTFVCVGCVTALHNAINDLERLHNKFLRDMAQQQPGVVGVDAIRGEVGKEFRYLYSVCLSWTGRSVPYIVDNVRSSLRSIVSYL